MSVSTTISFFSFPVSIVTLPHLRHRHPFRPPLTSPFLIFAVAFPRLRCSLSLSLLSYTISASVALHRLRIYHPLRLRRRYPSLSSHFFAPTPPPGPPLSPFTVSVSATVGLSRFRCRPCLSMPLLPPSFTVFAFAVVTLHPLCLCRRYPSLHFTLSSSSFPSSAAITLHRLCLRRHRPSLSLPPPPLPFSVSAVAGFTISVITLHRLRLRPSLFLSLPIFVSASTLHRYRLSLRGCCPHRLFLCCHHSSPSPPSPSPSQCKLRR